MRRSTVHRSWGMTAVLVWSVAICAAGCTTHDEAEHRAVGVADPNRRAADRSAPLPGARATDERSTADRGATTTEQRPSGSPVTLEEVDREQFDQCVARHRGSVVLVDFWATWCVPCKKKFPQVLQWQYELARQGLIVISLSVDDPDQRGEVVRQLEQWDARITNLISRHGAGTASATAFEFDGAVPFYKLYDRQGKLRFQFSGLPEGLKHVEGLDQIRPRIDQLLAEDPYSGKSDVDR